MRVRIIGNSRLPGMLGVRGITLYPFVFLTASVNEAVANNELQHEYVHVLQIRELGVLRFYAEYMLQFALGLVMSWSWSKAYRAIDFEVEAYRRQSALCPRPTIYTDGTSWYLD